jgi:hypothetical protein
MAINVLNRPPPGIGRGSIRVWEGAILLIPAGGIFRLLFEHFEELSVYLYQVDTGRQTGCG